MSKAYTYADYLTWRFKERVELILGKIFRMSPAPSSQHQKIVGVITNYLFTFLKGKSCHAFPAPFDVILPLGESGKRSGTVVQPDITVVCDKTKIKPHGCEGVPDLVVEIVSKFSVTRDLHEKYFVYELAGVKEYWVVNPNDHSLNIFLLDENGQFQPTKPLTRGDVAKSRVLPGFELLLDDLFSDVVEEPLEYYTSAHRL